MIFWKAINPIKINGLKERQGKKGFFWTFYFKSGIETYSCAWFNCPYELKNGMTIYDLVVSFKKNGNYLNMVVKDGLLKPITNETIDEIIDDMSVVDKVKGNGDDFATPILTEGDDKLC